MKYPSGDVEKIKSLILGRHLAANTIWASYSLGGN